MISWTLFLPDSPKNLSISNNGNVHYIGEEIECLASANPAPFISWHQISPPEGNSTNGSVLLITATMMDYEQEWRCEARNSFDNQSYLAFITHSFNVGKYWTELYDQSIRFMNARFIINFINLFRSEWLCKLQILLCSVSTGALLSCLSGLMNSYSIHLYSSAFNDFTLKKKKKEFGT